MLGWKLRACKPDLWFRIHSLPESKRYPETKDEENIIISRHNEIAKEVLGTTTNLYLYWHWTVSFHGINGIKTSNYKDDDIETTLYSAEVEPWITGKYDQVIISVANDELSQIIFMNPKNGNIYAPYDGGADIFLTDEKTRNDLKKQFSKWASGREDGM